VSSNYAIGGRSGDAVLAFTIAEPGQYYLSAGYPDGSTEPQGVLAVGFAVPQRILSTILQAMGIGAIGFVLGIIVAVVTFIKRRRAIRRQPAVRSPESATAP
jgi:hypothetical protein